MDGGGGAAASRRSPPAEARTDRAGAVAPNERRSGFTSFCRQRTCAGAAGSLVRNRCDPATYATRR